MKDLSQKTVLVTGGNRGIGLAIARGLLTKGCTVVITSRTLEKAQKAAETLESLSDRVIPLELDTSDDRSIARAADALASQIEKLDVLVNNAGVYPDNNIDMLSVPRETLAAAMNANAFGPVQVVQAFLPLLEKSSAARVINVSSGMGSIDGLTTTAPSYCLSKLALNGVTIMLAQSLQAKGIAVNSMGPGWVKTDMGGESAPRSPEQGADTAIWLATEAPHGETGKFWRDRHEIVF